MLEQTKHINNLIRFLAHPKLDKAVRIRGRLEAIGSPAVDALIRAAGSPIKEVRVQAIIALGCIGDRSAYDTLIRLTHDPDDFVRYEAIWSLGLLGDERAIPYLIQLAQSVETNPGSVEYALSEFGERAVPALLDLLRTGTKDGRIAAAYTLGDTYDLAVIDELSALLEDNDLDIRIAGIESLARTAEENLKTFGQRYLDLIKPLLNDPTDSVRNNASYWDADIRKQLAEEVFEQENMPYPWRLRLLVHEKRKSDNSDARVSRIRYYRWRRRSKARI